MLSSYISNSKADLFTCRADLELVLNHKLASVLLYVKKQDLGGHYFSDRIYFIINGYLKNYQREYNHKYKIFKNFTDLLSVNKIPYVIRKGRSLKNAYVNGDHKISNDFDILIDSTNVLKIEKLFSDSGFVKGIMNINTCSIENHSRRTAIQYRLNPDHLMHYSKSEFGVIAEIDVALELGWFGDSLGIDTSEVLKNIEINSDSQYILTPEYRILEVGLHIFKDVYMLGNLLKKQPSLAQFLDIYLLVEKFPKSYLAVKNKYPEAYNCINRVLVLFTAVLTQDRDLLMADREIYSGGVFRDGKVNKHSLLFTMAPVALG